MWIARDKYGKLFLYKNKPHKFIDFFLGEEGDFFYSENKSIEINSPRFPEVTFENSPQKVKIILINDLNSELK